VLERTTFFMATSESKTLPQSVAEVVFVGRSNVGKSSVINALCSNKNLARTSKTPGRTRSINVYSIVIKKWLIDLPGYGFARVSFKEKDLWNKMIEECIIQRKSKKTVYVIIDAFVGPTGLDFDMACWLKEHKINFKIAVNKCDKLPSSISQEEITNKTAEIFKIESANIFAVSAKQRNGFYKLQLDIIKFLDIK
jgi:GTP-binding protein